MSKQDWIRVSEYARREGISVVAANKRIKNPKFGIESKKEYGLTLIKVKQ